VTKLLIHPNYCAIREEPDVGFLWALDRELSFDVQGAKHTVAYRGFYNKDGHFVKWDGKRRLLTENLHFPLGLLQRVQDFYHKDQREIEVQDCRPAKAVGNSLDILPKLKALGKEPYPYQWEAVEAVKRQDHGIIRLATGGGKTVVAALMTAELGKSTIVYVIGKDLLYQIHNLFSSLFDQKIGLIGDGVCEIHDINVASIWTVGQALGLTKASLSNENDDEATLDPQKYQDIRHMMSTAKVHIFDECHVAACQTIQSIAEHINPEHIYGMSASPWRDDNADLLIECVLGKNIINISASTLIEQGFLVKPIIKFLSVPPMEGGGSKQHYQTIYKNYIVNNPVRNSYVIKGAEKLVEQGYQTLVLYNSVAHGELLYEQLAQKIPCILLSGKHNTEFRETAKKRLEKREVNCIIASKIFDIGVDLPSLSGLVVASSGKSSVRALQRVGRVIRRYPNKKQAAVLDFLDHAPYLKEHAIERRKIYSSEERFEVLWPTQT
jgi:superfamily II DNA or RNA helicase